jgi:hypothetical protein
VPPKIAQAQWVGVVDEDESESDKTQRQPDGCLVKDYSCVRHVGGSLDLQVGKRRVLYWKFNFYY